MGWQFRLIGQLVSGGITGALAVHAWRHRQVQGATTFAGLMWLVTAWNAGATLSNLSPSSASALFWFKAYFSCLVAVPVAWLTFALQYAGRRKWLVPPRLTWLAGLPAVTLLLTWTDLIAGLFWRDIEFAKEGALLVPDWTFGPWFWVHTTYSYALVLLGIVLLAQMALRALRLYRQQSVALLVGALAPFLTNVPATFGWTKLPLMPIGFTISGLTFAWAIFRYQLLDLVPVARDVLVDRMSDGMIVLDAQNRIVDLNPAMQKIAGLDAGQAVGRSVTEVLRHRRDLVERFLDASQAQAELAQERGGEVRHYDLRVSPLSDRGGRLTGRLVVLRDISDHKRAEEALRQYTHELEVSNAELDAFAHTVAHDLKTPLTTLVGFSKLLEKRYPRMKPERVGENLRTITQTGYKMTNIIDELLLLASVRKMEQVEIGPLNMAAIVQEALSRFADSIAEAQAEVVLPNEWPIALGYAPWVEEVWVNYISNAFKYGGTPLRVELGAIEQAGGTVRFWVRDNGPGLTAEDQSRLFAQFTRLHQIQAEGHGLGLSIVQRIVEKLGGQVGVESDGLLGRGSLFYFVLPAGSE